MLYPDIIRHTHYNSSVFLINNHHHHTIFSFLCGKLMFRISRLQAAQYCASSSDNPFSLKSCLMLSIHLHFCLPFLLCQVMLDAVHPPPLLSSFPSLLCQVMLDAVHPPPLLSSFPSLLCQVMLDVVHPPPLLSSFPSLSSHA